MILNVDAKTGSSVVLRSSVNIPISIASYMSYVVTLDQAVEMRDALDLVIEELETVLSMIRRQKINA